MEISNNILTWSSSLCVVLLFSTLVAFVNSYARKGKYCLPPGPSPLPVLGNVLLLIRNRRQPHRCLARLAENAHGPIMTLRLGSMTSIVISSSDLARHVLLKNGFSFSTPFVSDTTHAHRHDKYSIATLPSSSPQWRALRKIYGGQLLSDKRLNSMHGFRRQKVVKLMAYVDKCSQNGAAVDIGQAAQSTFFQIMLNTVFSRDFVENDRINDEKSREIENLIYQIIDETTKPNVADLFPVLKFLDPQRIKHRLTARVVKLFKLFNDIIHARLVSSKLLDGQVLHHSSSHINNDILDVLLGVLEEQRDGIDRDCILHLLLDLFGAGMNTTSRAIEWAMSELLRNPMILSEVREELDKTIGKGKLVEETDIPKLPYFRAVLKETLRLHPPVPLLLPRTIEQDIEVGGFTLPKGVQLVVNVWAIGRDPSTWTNPHSFIPDRFFNSDIDVKGQHFDLIPFGAGCRICPGMSFALRTISSLLATLVNCYTWKIEDVNDLNKHMDMEDEVKITLKKVKPLLATPAARV